MAENTVKDHKSLCIAERLSKTSVGVIFLLMALGAVTLGVTVLPFFGFILAAPLVLLAWFFFRTQLNDQCQIGS